MKTDPDLPRLLALAVLAVLLFMACFPGNAGANSEVNIPEAHFHPTHG